MERKLHPDLEKLLREQNFAGKTVSVFAGKDDLPALAAFLKKRMAAKVLEGEYSPCDCFLFWLAKADVKKCYSALRGKGKAVFLKQAGDHSELKDKLWEAGFLITRHFVARVTPTGGLSYSKTGEPEEFLFLVADKVNF